MHAQISPSYAVVIVGKYQKRLPNYGIRYEKVLIYS